uniref:20 kDa chaperonin, chloroplastic n=1 Tax=Picea sitchensis TaxID=3332 RepID=A9NU15_PICSI|nr:unknown [Picea sitchensis]
MATSQLGCASTTRVGLLSFEGLRSSINASSSRAPCSVAIRHQPFRRNLVVKAATTVAPKFTTIKPLGDRVLVKIQAIEEKSRGGILLPDTTQDKPQGGEVVAVGEGKSFSKTQVEPSVQLGAKIIYSKYAGTELEFNGVDHLLLKEDDIVGLLETETAKEKPSTGTVIAVGPGMYDEEGNRKPINISPGKTVLYSKYAGNEFKSSDGSQYVSMRVSDVIAVMS